jgi:hypothetical protein
MGSDSASIANTDRPQDLGIRSDLYIVAQNGSPVFVAAIADRDALAECTIASDPSSLMYENAAKMPDAEAWSDLRAYR